MKTLAFLLIAAILAGCGARPALKVNCDHRLRPINAPGSAMDPPPRSPVTHGPQAPPAEGARP
jgi:hypothetical protein